MATPVSRDTVQAFLQAFASRDPGRIGPFLHDDVRWNIVGPVELIKFCGEWCGKATVLDLFSRIIPGVIKMTGYDPEQVLVDGDRCAVLARMSGIKPDTGRAISYRCTQFVRFKDGKVIDYQSITDTFDAAEQLVGHPFDVGDDTGMPGPVVGRDVVALL